MNNFITGELLVHAEYEDTVRGLLTEIPETNPYKEDPRSEEMAELSGFTPFNEESWMSYRKGNVGIMEVKGTIVPEGRPWMTYMGASPLNVMEEEYRAMELDESINVIITRYASPGGIASGLTSHHKFLSGLTTKTVGFTESISASASYFAMTANKVLVAEEMASVGSIGTIMQFRKPSDDLITVVSDQSPLKDKTNPKNLHTLQSRSNELTDIFAKYVAIGRNTTVENVLGNFGQGDILLAEKAKERGMIDTVMTFAELIQEYSDNNELQGSQQTTSEEVLTTEVSMDKMTMAQLQSEHPDLFNEAQNAAKLEMQKEIDVKAKAESDRITSIMGLLEGFPSMSEAGKTAAMAVQSEALKTPTATAIETKLSMAMAILGVKETANENIVNHGKNVAAMAEEQGVTTPDSKDSLMDGKQTESFSNTVESLGKIGVNFGKVGR